MRYKIGLKISYLFLIISTIIQQIACKYNERLEQYEDILAQLSKSDQDIIQLEKEIKDIEIQRLDRIGFFQNSNIQSSTSNKKNHNSTTNLLTEEYSLKNQLPQEYVDNYNIFISGTKKKFNLKIDHKVKNVEFMQIKQNRASSSSNSNSGQSSGVSNDFTDQYIMIVFTFNNYILLYDFQGRLIHEYYAGHQIYKYATLQQNEEQTIYTLGHDYSVKHHIIRPLKRQDIEWIQKSDNNNNNNDTSNTIIKIKGSNEFKIIEKNNNSTNANVNASENITGDNSNKNKKKKSINLLIEYEGEFNVKQPINSNQNNQTINQMYTAFEVYSQKSNKYVMIGDSSGHIHVYFKNGTKIGKSAVSRHPITQILKHYPYPLYATKNQIGFFNQGTLHTAYPQCDLTPEDIIYMTIDGQHSQNIFVLQKNMEILIYDMKSQKSSCSVLMKLTSGDIEELERKNINKVSIQQLHNYIIFQQYDSPITKVLNITNFKSKNADIMLDIGFYLSGFGSSTSTSSQQYSLDYVDPEGYFQYQTHKHSSNYGILAYFEHTHYPLNSTEITVFVVHTQSPSWNFTENFKMPVIAIILIVFFFISYCRKKKKTTFDDVSMANIDNLIKDIQSGKKTIPNYKKDD